MEKSMMTVLWEGEGFNCGRGGLPNQPLTSTFLSLEHLPHHPHWCVNTNGPGMKPRFQHNDADHEGE